MIKALQSRISQLEKHIEDQDVEIYRLTRRVESLVQALQQQQNQLTALAESGSAHNSQPGSPASEKPPHY